MADAKPVPFSPTVPRSKVEHPSIVSPGPTVPMLFPTRVLLTLPGFRVVEFREGIQQVPEALMEHPYLLAHGVKRYHAESYGEMQERVEKERLIREEELAKQKANEDEVAKVKERIEEAVAALIAKGNSEETSRRIVSEIGPDMALEQLKADAEKLAANQQPPAVPPAVVTDDPKNGANAKGANVAKGKKGEGSSAT